MKTKSPRIFACLCLILVVFGSSAQGLERGSTSDGRFNSKCHAYAGDGPELELCTVPFYRLLAFPERYDGKLIAITGFLKEEFSIPTLFPSKESFLLDVDLEGIDVLVNKLPKEIMVELKNGLSPVYIIGIFDAKYQAGNLERLGALKNIRTVKRLGELLDLAKNPVVGNDYVRKHRYRCSEFG